MKIGILTYHRSINYGAFLQAYCLARFVKKIAGNRADVEIIDYSSKIAYQQYNRALFHGNNIMDEWKKRIEFERSRLLMPLSKESLYSDDMEKAACFLRKQKYNLIIVGSDEVWKIDGMRGFPTAYWLNFDLGHCEKIAYAVSARTALNRIDQQKRNYINQSVEQFRYLGVRDQMTLNLIQKITEKKSILNCDPAFLIQFQYNRESYKQRFYKKNKLDKNQKLLGVMISDPKLIAKIKIALGADYKIVALFDSHGDADINMVGINPFEWIKMIGCLDFFVTDRFHGTVFAIKMGIPFLSVETYDEKENSKLYYLLSSNGLEEHYIVYRAGNTVYNEILEKIAQLSQKEDADKMHCALLREEKKSKSFRRELLKIIDEHSKKEE